MSKKRRGSDDVSDCGALRRRVAERFPASMEMSQPDCLTCILLFQNLFFIRGTPAIQQRFDAARAVDKCVIACGVVTRRQASEFGYNVSLAIWGFVVLLIPNRHVRMFKMFVKSFVGIGKPNVVRVRLA